VNVESWDIVSNFNIADTTIRSSEFPDGVVKGNTELELDLQSAEKLVRALQAAIAEVRRSEVS